jgi:NAD(P)-dependent dehydrogenase (short-subunit alcohol dehydrogenase family)
MSGDLSGKTVLITGGNVGIGRATAFELARKKAEVVIVGRSEESCETTVEEISALTKNNEVFKNSIADFP